MLPVPQIRESHARYLDPMGVDPVATVAAPPYAGMAVNDVVDFHFASTMPVKLTFTVRPDDVGEPVLWLLDTNDVWNAYTQVVDTWYEVMRADVVVATSAIQVFTIDAGPDDRLPAPSVVGHEGGGLDPGAYPDGVSVAAPLYDDAAMGDVVLLYWSGNQPARSTVVPHEVTQADLDAREIQIAVGPEWLQANIGGQVTLMYQYARQGAAASSQALTLEVLVPLELAAPHVERAESEGGDEVGNRRGYLLAANARSGVYVQVPEAEEVADAVALVVHWDGHPYGGQHVADAPHEAGTPLRFFIPATAVPANIGPELRRFDITYVVTLAEGREHRSKAFQLWIKALPLNEYGAPQCRQAQGKPGLSLADVPPEGAELYVTTWPFIAAGQQLSLWILGVDAAGAAAEYIARDAVEVAQGEIDARAISGRVPADVLTTLKTNSIFNLRAKVSHNGGDSTLPFQQGSVRWLG